MINDEYVVSIIDAIIIDPNVLVEARGEGEHLNYVLEDEIISTIGGLYPFLNKRYQIKSKLTHEKMEEKEEIINIDIKNEFGATNFIKLCLFNFR